MTPLLAAALALISPQPVPSSPAVVGSAPASASGAFPTARRSSAQELERNTAREDIAVLAESRQTASVASSSVNGTSVTGEAAIAGQAFQNASGLTLVNINTGNNVAMNASMNVNVIINPKP